MVDIFYSLQWIADKLTYEVFGIAPETRLAASVNFIIYDMMKIFVLLAVMIFFISYIRLISPPKKQGKCLEIRKDSDITFLHLLSGQLLLFVLALPSQSS